VKFEYIVAIEVDGHFEAKERQVNKICEAHREHDKSSARLSLSFATYNKQVE